MTYTTAAKTDKPTDWKALWISFGDGAFSKKNDSHGSDLSFNRSSRRGECGLSKYGTCLRFPIFRMGCCGEDDWVVVDPLVSGDGQTVSYQPHIHANTIRSSREQHRCSHNL